MMMVVMVFVTLVVVVVMMMPVFEAMLIFVMVMFVCHNSVIFSFAKLRTFPGRRSSPKMVISRGGRDRTSARSTDG